VHDQLSKWKTKYSWDEGKHEVFFKIGKTKDQDMELLQKWLKYAIQKEAFI
jgi:hypothetical protein